MQNKTLVNVVSFVLVSLVSLSLWTSNASATEVSGCRYVAEVQSKVGVEDGAVTVAVIETEVLGEGAACQEVGARLSVVVSNTGVLENDVAVGDLVVLQMTNPVAGSN